ncbi:MAG: porin family protein [Methylococcales bacterium]|nr:porin family protein [Methylococcales bacterium]
MMNKTNSCLGVALATLTMAGAMVSPQVAAGSKAERMSEAANAKVEILEAQLRAMQDEIAGLKAQVSAPADAQKVQELDAWMASVKSQPVEAKTKDNMVFFRGGYARFDDDRGGTLDPTSVSALGLSSSNGTLVGPITDKDAWYFGAGFDFSLDDNLWGLMDDTEVLAELGVNYTELATQQPNGLSPQETATIAAATGIILPAANTESATVNMATVSASPKIKFLKGSAFRPWLIPVGFELNVVSPPSDAITVLTPGMVFGAGADYKIWKNLYVGADVRYHYAPGNVDGINVNNFNAGGYLGIGF